jgi:hypothetical protein
MKMMDKTSSQISSEETLSERQERTSVSSVSELVRQAILLQQMQSAMKPNPMKAIQERCFPLYKRMLEMASDHHELHQALELPVSEQPLEATSKVWDYNVYAMLSETLPLFHEALYLLLEEEKVASWLITAEPLLGNQTPLDFYREKGYTPFDVPYLNACIYNQFNVSTPISLEGLSHQPDIQEEEFDEEEQLFWSMQWRFFNDNAQLLFQALGWPVDTEFAYDDENKLILPKWQRDAIQRLDKVLKMAQLYLMWSNVNAGQWVLTPNSCLDNRTPAQVLQGSVDNMLHILSIAFPEFSPESQGEPSDAQLLMLEEGQTVITLIRQELFSQKLSQTPYCEILWQMVKQAGELLADAQNLEEPYQTRIVNDVHAALQYYTYENLQEEDLRYVREEAQNHLQSLSQDSSHSDHYYEILGRLTPWGYQWEHHDEN